MRTATGVEIYSVKVAAARLGVSRARVSQMVNEGKLGYVMLDGSRYVDAQSLRIEQERRHRLLKRREFRI